MGMSTLGPLPLTHYVAHPMTYIPAVQLFSVSLARQQPVLLMEI